MSGAATEPAEEVFAKVGRVARERIRADKGLRRNLPGSGRLYLDRLLPFLAVYRSPEGRLDPGTDRLAMSLSAHLVASGDPALHAPLCHLVREVAEEAASELGAFLLLEIWTRQDGGPGDEAGERKGDLDGLARPALEIVGRSVESEVFVNLAEAFRLMELVPRNDGELGLSARTPDVGLRRESEVGPPGLPPLSLPEGGPDHVLHVGVELAPFFRQPSTGALYPRVLEVLREEFSVAVARGLFDFSQKMTSLDPPHFRALGRRGVGRRVRHVDRRLGEVASAYDLLLQVTPVNTEEAWRAFRDGGCQEAPLLRYRPLPFDPEGVKRRLFDVPIDGVEDPLLASLFREKQEEMDREITMMRDLATPAFVHGSLQLYGGVEDDLLALAGEVLEAIPPSVRDDEEYGDETDAGHVESEAFARAAREEIDRYRQLDPDFVGDVRIEQGITAGLMVSQGVLLVSDSLKLPRHRVDALLQHEVGTHVVTYSNGRAQPFRIFAAGLAGYDPLQEGLAVLAEYLVRGLTPSRARVLAGRVLAVRALEDEADFVETFRMLREEGGFPPRTAFIITLRVHRGGGLTKDAHYLRGLRDLLAYLADDRPLEPLFVGKLGLGHSEVVQELVLRGILRLPAVKPRYTSDLGAMERLGACRHMSVIDVLRGGTT